MRKLLIFLLLFLLCSCNNTTPTNLIVDKEKIDDDIELFNYSNENENKNKYLAKLEASIIDDAKVLPLNASNVSIITHAIKSNNNPVIINGKNYYKFKNHVNTENIINNETSNIITNECYKKGITYYQYAKDKDIKLNSIYTIPFSIECLCSLDYYNFDNDLQNEILLQCNDSLLEIDIFGNVIPNLAESYEIPEDKLIYTFKLKDNAYFIDSTGNKYCKIKAKDYITGFDYMKSRNINISLFEDVIITEIDDNTLKFTLDHKDSDFIYKIANNSIIPINLEFFESKGGILYPSYKTSGSYGNANSLSNSLYTGAYYPTLISDDKIILKLNPHYYDNNLSIKEINYIKDDENLLEKFHDKRYSEVELPNISNIDNSLINHKYIDSSIRYALINTKRENYEVYNSNIKTNKTIEEIENSKEALDNLNFRKALLSCIDRSLFSLGGNEINNLSLYDVSIIANEKSMLYSEYIKSLLKNNIKYDLSMANTYYQRFLKDVNVTKPIIIDVLCFKDIENMKNIITNFKEIIESTFGKDQIIIDIIYCDNSYEYFLAGHHKYQCYDLYFDFTVNLEYNSRYKYIKEIIKYI